MGRVLSAAPRLTTLYAAALARSVTARLGGGNRNLDLLRDRHRLDGVTASPEKVGEFQELMGSPRSGFLPSGYVHTLAFPVAASVLARRDFPLPLLGMVHLRNQVRHLRPIALDERLSVTAWVENLAPHRSGTQVDLVVQVQSGSEQVWKGRSTYLAKGIHPTGSGSEASAPAGSMQGEELPGYPTGVWVLDGATGRRYAAVSGDYNPIHLAVPSARAFGLARPIAHGMYLASRMVADAGPGDAAPFSWSVNFRTPVQLPSTVFLAAHVDRSSTSVWRAAEVVAWDPHRRRTHFSASMERLGDGS